MIDWTDDTMLEDYDDLRALLRECRNIDHASHITDRLKRIIELAESLGRSRWKEGEKASLIHFLDDEYHIEGLRRMAEKEAAELPKPKGGK